ncbi:CatB-related O-acetyltransferase [Pseudoduganella plicata]|uniref:CatB-related O-acetyltransferase n=1 Tax=Pseudoduganella plicata TaxID=321984 RepID=A0A4P7BBE6_9BURK|nr:CatB-related O-acetyltransferase [Pseudoduganella plicata]QBQ35460.1 CatB-related O-acetyltransferase [Pseudoduganella plicata]GGZ01963.1 Vat family streptogramin A O-acetyltransferase [Pseudoduganella plicata]
MHGPHPDTPFPMPGFPQVCYLKNVVDDPQIEIGEYTYYDDPDGHENFRRNVLYLFPFIGDKLRIGRFCALARGVKFIMNGANHQMDGISTYPFFIFGNGWESARPAEGDLPYKGDTVIGNDVWIGYDVLIMPGVTIGDGAIVAARSVVTADVPPYTIAGGNPAKPLRARFDADTVRRLQAIAWWDRPVDWISAHLPLIRGGDVAALESAAR